MAKKNQAPVEETATSTATIDPQGAERFTHLAPDAQEYPLLSVHVFEGVRYRVDAVMLHAKGVAIEFVKVP